MVSLAFRKPSYKMMKWWNEARNSTIWTQEKRNVYYANSNQAHTLIVLHYVHSNDINLFAHFSFPFHLLCFFCLFYDVFIFAYNLMAFHRCAKNIFHIFAIAFRTYMHMIYTKRSLSAWWHAHQHQPVYKRLINLQQHIYPCKN